MGDERVGSFRGSARSRGGAQGRAALRRPRSGSGAHAGGARRRRVLSRHRRRGRRDRGRGQAAGGVLRGAGRRGLGRARRGLRLRAGGGPARDRRREARRRPLDGPRLRGRVRADRRRGDREPLPRLRLARALPRARRARRACLAEDLQPRQRRHPGPAFSRTAGRCGSTSPASSIAWGEDRVGASGISSFGAVVGATHPEILETVREPAAARSAAPARASARRAASPEYLAAGVHGRPGERARVRLARRSSTPIEARAGRRPRRPRPSGSPASCAPSPPWAEPWTGAASRAGPRRSPSSPRSRSVRSSSGPGSSKAGSHHATSTTTTVTSTTKKKHGQPPKGQAARTYTVVSGDTLASIATKTGTTVATLEKLNPGIDPTALRSVRRSASSNLRRGVVHRQ